MKDSKPKKVIASFATFAANQQHPSYKFMVEDLRRSELEPNDFPGVFEPRLQDNPPRYRINYPLSSNGAYRDRFKRPPKTKEPKYLGKRGVNDVFILDAAMYQRWKRAKRKVIVEGEKSLLAMIKYLGRDGLAIGGCWNFSRAHEPHPDVFDHIHEGDVIEFLIDSDVTTKVDVGLAAQRFVDWCEERGATVVVRNFDTRTNGDKVGVDDWLVDRLHDGTTDRAALIALYEALPTIDHADFAGGDGLTEEERRARLAELQARYALVSVPPVTRVLDQETTREKGQLTLHQYEDLRLLLASDFYYQQTSTGVRQIILLDDWKKSRKTTKYENGIVFVIQPGAQIPGAFNLWTGFALAPLTSPVLDTKSIQPWLDVLNAVVTEAHARDWLINWLAHLIQCPWELPGTGPGIRGNQGTGKSSLFEPFRYILGQHHFAHLSTEEELMEKFNASTELALMRVFDEAIFGKNRKQLDRLKGEFTRPTRAIEAKFMPKREVSNYTRNVLLSNHERIVTLEKNLLGDDRRYMLVEASDRYVGDTAFWERYYRWLYGDGPTCLMTFLSRHDISRFNPRVVVDTDVKRDLKRQSMGSDWAFFEYLYFDENAINLHKTLYDKENGVTKQKIFDAYRNWCGARRLEPSRNHTVSYCQWFLKPHARELGLVMRRPRGKGGKQVTSEHVFVPTQEDGRAAWERRFGTQD